MLDVIRSAENEHHRGIAETRLRTEFMMPQRNGSPKQPFIIHASRLETNFWQMSSQVETGGIFSNTPRIEANPGSCVAGLRDSVAPSADCPTR